MPEEVIVDAQVVDEDPMQEEPGGAQAPPPGATPPGSGVAPAGPTALIDARGPAAIIRKATKIANEADQLIAAQGFRTQVGGTAAEPKWHVDVEGWQVLGTLLGVATVERPGYPRRIAPRVRYTARVEHFKGQGTKRRLERVTTFDVDGWDYESVHDVYRNGTLIASGRGLCSRTEARWARADEYAVASMASTRSLGRALASATRWIIRLAGYQSTPAAEVDLRQSSGPTYGPAAAADLEPRVRRALAYLLDVDRRPNGEPVDEEAHEVVQDAITALVAEADGYMPHVVARAAMRLAAEVNRHRLRPDAPNPADVPQEDTTR